MPGSPRVVRIALLFAMVMAVFGTLPTPAIADDMPFADPAFENVWQQADQTVASGETQRSWLWGPSPIGASRDYYVESTAPGAQRLVQYFDKSRMEITLPDGDASSQWYVTNGLLVKELVSGMRQRGNEEFSDWGPSHLAVAGDLGEAANLSYADFQPYVTLDGASNRAADRTGQQIDASLLPESEPGNARGYPVATYGTYEPTLGHNIADVFWTWMNNPANGILTYGTWVYPMGFPISEPYWTEVTIGGQPQHVLVQLFERRVLTYTPTNPAAWQVEMGNVGAAYLHSYESDYIASADFFPNDENSIVINAQAHGNEDIFSVAANGNVGRMTDSPWDERLSQALPSGHVVFSSSRSGDIEHYLAPGASMNEPFAYSWPNYAPDGVHLAFSCGGICVVDPFVNIATQITGSMVDGSTRVGDWVWSPDSQYLAFEAVSQIPGDQEYDSVVRVGDRETGDSWQIGVDDFYLAEESYIDVLTWLDGTTLVLRVEAEFDGEWQTRLQVVDVTAPETVSDFVIADATDVRAASTGQLVLTRELIKWQSSIWTANLDGSNLTQVTDGPSHFEPRWNHDGTMIVFIEYDATTGDPGVSVVNADGSGHKTVFRP